MKILILSILFITSCSHTPKQKIPTYELATYEFPLKKYSKLIEGGFSGLHYEGKDKYGDHVFWTHTDRGPNAESYKDQKTGFMNRPFVQPNFNPHIIKFKYSPKNKSIRYTGKINLKRPDGSDLTGLPNLRSGTDRTGDEAPVTIVKRSLDYDLLGIDPEGICINNKDIWMVEEYGPSILKFDQTGKLVTRYVPNDYYIDADLNWLQQKYGKDSIKQVLPKKLLRRRLNRGFEGIACHENKIYAVLQSPLPDEDRNILTIEFDTKQEKVLQLLTYQLDSLDVDKIGDIHFHNGSLYFIEQNSLVGPEGIHNIYRASLKNIENNQLKKEFVLDLTKIGFDFADKVEGLSILSNGDIFVLNDNDFGLTGAIDLKSNEADVDSNRKSLLGHIKKK